VAAAELFRRMATRRLSLLRPGAARAYLLRSRLIQPLFADGVVRAA
jgi:hypothetical protein